MKTNRRNHPLWIMPILLILWGSYAAVSKLALSGLDSFQMLFYTFGSSFVMFSILLIANGRIRRLFTIDRREMSRLLLNGLPFYMYYLLYSLAMLTIPVVEASMLNYLFPLLIVLLSIPMFGEKLNAVTWLAILCAFIGMLLIVTKGRLTAIGLSNLGGDLLAVAAAMSWALFSVFGKKNGADQDLAVYVYTVSAFLLSTIGLLGFSTFVVPDGASFGMAVWLGFSNIVFGNLLWFRALKTFPSPLLAGFTYLSPFATLLFISVLLKEQIRMPQLAGFLIILAGIAIQLVPAPKKLKIDTRHTR